jgi:hypothetical protein
MNIIEQMKKSHRKRLKIKNLEFNNALDSYGFPTFIEEELNNPNNPIVLTGNIPIYDFLNSKVGIDYYQYKNDDNKIMSQERLMQLIHHPLIITTEIDTTTNKISHVYILGDVCGHCYFLGRLKPEDNYTKHALRVFRAFWDNGAGLDKLLKQ